MKEDYRVYLLLDRHKTHNELHSRAGIQGAATYQLNHTISRSQRVRCNGRTFLVRNLRRGGVIVTGKSDQGKSIKPSVKGQSSVEERRHLVKT